MKTTARDALSGRHAHPDVLARWDELTEDGAFGDASKATREIGQELCATAFDRISEFVESFIAPASGSRAKRSRSR